MMSPRSCVKNSQRVVKSKDGTILSKESEIRERWKEHFNKVLNRTEPAYPAYHFENNQEVLDIELGIPSRDEIRTVRET